MASYFSLQSTGMYRLSGSGTVAAEVKRGEKESSASGSGIKKRIVSGSASLSRASAALSSRLTGKSKAVDVVGRADKVNTTPGIKRRDSIQITKEHRKNRSPENAQEDHLEEEEKDEGHQGAQVTSGTAVFGTSDTGSSPQKKVRGILSSSKDPSERRWNQGKRRVVFNKSATLHYMPAHELDSARLARQGSWEAAPEHDELWDGDLQDFRRVPLTKSQMDRFGGRSNLNYTYPPASNENVDFDFGIAGSNDMDDLDSYMEDLSLGSSGQSSQKDTFGDKQSPHSKSSCYVCLATIDWPVKHVSSFIREIVSGGEFLCSSFEQNYVDGPMFMQMEERDLRNIGVKRRADRQAILDAKSELLKGSLGRQSCSCSKLSAQSVLDKHSRFLQSTRSFLNTL